MIDIQASDALRAAPRGWTLGLLEVEGLQPRSGSGALDAEASRVEESLKARFGGMNRRAIARTEPARFYDAHFGAAGRAYPVILQAEAVASKGRRIEMPDPLVRAMFAAELEGMLLCSGQDLAALDRSVSVDLASGLETMQTFGGPEKTPPAGDLVIRDALGIVASVLLGPDERTSLRSSTSEALFTIYAPPSIREEEIRAQLARLEVLARLACAGARAGARRIMRL
jgi:hypothetical protein